MPNRQSRLAYRNTGVTDVKTFTRSELIRLLKEQIKARQSEMFGGFSKAERDQYNARAKRIRELDKDLTKG